MQPVAPDEYAALNLPDQFIEDWMQEKEAQWIVEQTKDYWNILELGYGSGIVTKALRDAGKKVTVIEGSSEFCRRAREAGAYTVHGLFETAITPRVRYDCVIASFILEHVESPVAILRRCREWSDRLIVVIGNANSYHRRLAVQMGLQPELNTLSARDRAVGHLRVYDLSDLDDHLYEAGWERNWCEGFMLKPLPNSMLVNLPPEVVRAMCSIHVRPDDAANIGMVCSPIR